MLGSVTCRQVLGVYRGREWAFIEEHLHDVLGKQSRDAGDLDAAIGHFAAMLPCRHSPENWQAFYLRQFLEVVQQAAGQRVRPLRLRPASGVSPLTICLSDVSDPTLNVDLDRNCFEIIVAIRSWS